jgi:hypothetical protein
VAVDPADSKALFRIYEKLNPIQIAFMSDPRSITQFQLNSIQKIISNNVMKNPPSVLLKKLALLKATKGTKVSSSARPNSEYLTSLSAQFSSASAQFSSASVQLSSAIEKYKGLLGKQSSEPKSNQSSKAFASNNAMLALYMTTTLHSLTLVKDYGSTILSPSKSKPFMEVVRTALKTVTSLKKAFLKDPSSFSETQLQQFKSVNSNLAKFKSSWDSALKRDAVLPSYNPVKFLFSYTPSLFSTGWLKKMGSKSSNVKFLIKAKKAEQSLATQMKKGHTGTIPEGSLNSLGHMLHKLQNESGNNTSNAPAQSPAQSRVGGEYLVIP